ncbi:MAG TPA: DNA-binding domain-containing protein [Alphaproteobacteria bacterium]|nr:DNA-binding domain-containing protein [Alphaproteobacteria bacterium]
MRLGRLQHAFSEYVLEGDGRIRTAVRPSSKADIDTLLGVYRHAYSARLVESLGIDFPGLKALAGEAEFDTLARAYIAANPSRGFSVRTVGAALPAFLSVTPPFAERPALCDMAAFEAAMADAFDAADAEPARLEQMGVVPAPAWPTLTFEFHPSVRRLQLRTQAPAAWADWNTNRTPLEPAAQSGHWLVWRQALDVKFRPIEADESAALDSAMAGREFAAICETLAEHGPEDAAAYRAAGLIRAWIETGLIAGFAHRTPLSA